MNIIEQTEKIEYLDFLIKSKKTGSARELSRRLEVSKNTIHRLIEIMRSLGCPICYSKTCNTYYYKIRGEIRLKFQEYKQERSYRTSDAL
jgi:predicted DNA-binding transcriptional regulator YafY